MANIKIDPQADAVIVTGTTGSGKTDLAISIAQQYDGELINADSRQIYRGVDIGSNKDLAKIKKHNIEFHLHSFADIDSNFSAAEFKSMAEQIVSEIKSRSKLPIVVGGTGLYLHSLINGLKTSELRPGLREQLNQLSVAELQSRVSKSYLSTMNESDRQNPRRLIRAIEKQNATTVELPARYKYQVVYLEFEFNELEEKLERRVETMWQQGLVSEVSRQLAEGIPRKLLKRKITGYHAVLDFLDGKMTEEEAKHRIILDHRQYAKRQLTWFRKYLKQTS